mgnify:CR=1 FL=1
MPKWTLEQQKAINTEGSNIIVSAGAGSGKTAVLTARVINKIKNGIHVNELLILTFTNNAAAEMKTRIKKAILEDEEIKKEAKLVESSSITTFDAFVLSLVKKYHYLLNLDQNISIIDSSIINNQKKNIINEIFNELYLENNQNFIDFVTSFCGKNDKPIKKIILSLDSKIDLLINKEEYLKNYINDYYSEENINFLFNEYVNNLLKRIETIKTSLYNLSFEAPEKFFNNYSQALTPLINAKTYDEIRNNLDIGSFRLTGSTENGKYYKSEITNIIKVLKSYTFYDKEVLINDLKSTKKYAEIIIDVLLKLNDKVSCFKRKYQMFEFNDISKMAINLIKNNDNIRNDLKYSFKEIMIDEYQDTSDIQEEFIKLIENNNVYMVGDIKQSIYRFRNANPDIFKIKYDLYKNNNGGIKIDLNKNFRSRDAVLYSINDIFNHIMDDELGNADYQKEHQLVFGNMMFNEIGNNSYNNNLEIYRYEKDDIHKKEEIEAFIIGNDIKEKVKNKYLVLDNTLRPCTYKDFCILMDRTSSFDIYKKVFDYLIIPLNIYKDENILISNETYLIKNIVGLIINIKNHIYDETTKFYFTSIARSYLFSMNDNEIYEIIINKKLSETTIYKYCLEIVNNLESFSNKELIETIIDKFDFYKRMITIGNINYRTIILNNLINKIADLNKVGIDIYGINDYLASLINDKEELKINALITESDSVTITNIHKSKGLEYKICYFSGFHKDFNMDEVKAKFIFNNKYGLIIPTYDNGIKSSFVAFINKEKYIKDEISEKIRLFYVALTRCKEKMIIVTELKDDAIMTADNNEVIDYLSRIKYKNFKNILESIYPYLEKYIKNVKVPEINNNYKINKEIDISNLKVAENEIIVNEIEEKNEVINEEHYSKEQNKLITNTEKENMLLGIKLHYILENIDFKNPNFSLLNEFEIDIVKNLLNNKLLENIKDAKIYKEYEFIYEENNISKTGVIDLLLTFENHNIIIDYKLKHTSDAAYLKQLTGYKNYIEYKTNKQTSIYLYSLLDKKLVDLN